MVLPTISEIIQAGNAMQSTTPQGTVIDITQGANQVFQAAQIKQQADWQRYSKFTENIQNFMADANEIAKVEIAPQDREVVQENLANALKEMSKNVTAIANPMADPAAYAQIKGQVAEAMSLAQKSKQRHAYDKLNDGYIKQNPEWSTATNKKILESSQKTNIKDWKPYTLGNPMPAFDIYKIGEFLNDNSKVKFQDEVVGGAKDPKTGAIGKGNEYIYTTKGFKYDDAKFRENFEATWNMQDKYNNVFSDWVETFVWDALPDAERKKYEDAAKLSGGNPLKEAGFDYVLNLKKKDELETGVDKNPVWEEKYKAEMSLKETKVNANSRRQPPNPTPTTIEGNALDSIPDFKYKEGAYWKDGKAYNADGTPYNGSIGIPKHRVSDQIVGVVVAGNPKYFGVAKQGEYDDEQPENFGASIDFNGMEADVVNGEIQSVRFQKGGRAQQTIDRRTIENYQYGQVKKFKSDGLPTPTYGRGGGRTEPQPTDSPKGKTLADKMRERKQ